MDLNTDFKYPEGIWSGRSPMRNPVHLRLRGLSFPSVESQLEPLFFISVLIHGLLIPS